MTGPAAALLRGCALLLLAAVAGAAASAQPVVVGGTTFRFATVEQGRAVIGSEDAWTAAMSDFHRRATLGVDEPVAVPRLLAFLATTVQPWPAAEEARWRKALLAIAPRLLELRVPMPPEVLLVDSDGRDAANAPYTRANAIFLPSAKVKPEQRNDTDERLLAHELFHVVSRHSPQLATRLYAALGFEPVPPLQWPAAWLTARIANPDAPFDRHAMRLESNGRSRQVMPLLVARRTQLAPGESFFAVLDVRLLEVTSSGGVTRPVLRDGEPVWQPLEEVPEFAARMGGNTRYIIHPEEATADNFSFLVTGRAVPNPALLARFEAILRAGP